MAVISTIIKESDGTRMKAVINQTDNGPFVIEYFINDSFKTAETFQNVSIHYVESAAENWLSGIKKLNE